MAAAIPTSTPAMPSSGRPSPTAAMVTERPEKKQRLADNARASLSTRQMDELEISLEVDHMILDYLLYQAIEACLTHPHTSWDDNVSPIERNLLQVDEFYALFRKRYPNYKLDAEIRFRRDLLQFTTLFTQRLRRNSTTPSLDSLKHLRKLNRARAYVWIGDASRQPTAGFDCTPLETSFPLPQAELDQHRARVLEVLGLPAEDDAYEDSFYGTCESASLLDLLPLFMKVSAACFAIFDVCLQSRWITMATALMVEATLEQFLVYGEDGSDAIDEAFAWGYKKDQDEKDETEDDKINSMFEDEEHAGEVPAWQSAKISALRVIFSNEGREIAKHFRNVHDTQSITTCETNITTFLKDISKGVPKPVLWQLEQGRLDDMTEEQTQAFIKSCGVDVERFLSQLA